MKSHNIELLKRQNLAPVAIAFIGCTTKELSIASTSAKATPTEPRKIHHHHSTKDKAKAVQMINSGSSQKEAAAWISSETGYDTHHSLMGKWRHQQPVITELARQQATP